jgi:hypothetical protein
MNMNKLEHRDEPPAELISGVLSDARDFAVAEVDRLKAEATSQLKDIGHDLKVASLGLLILTVAAIMLGTAFALGLFELGLPAWLAFGIIAIVFAASGVGFLKSQKAKAAPKSDAA